MGALPHTYYKQGIKTEMGETIAASLLTYFKSYNGSAKLYLQLYDETNSAVLDEEELSAATEDFVKLAVSAVIPTGCTNVEVRWGLEDAVEGDTVYIDKVRTWRGSTVRLVE